MLGIILFGRGEDEEGSRRKAHVTGDSEAKLAVLGTLERCRRVTVQKGAENAEETSGREEGPCGGLRVQGLWRLWDGTGAGEAAGQVSWPL